MPSHFEFAVMLAANDSFRLLLALGLIALLAGILSITEGTQWQKPSVPRSKS